MTRHSITVLALLLAITMLTGCSRDTVSDSNPKPLVIGTDATYRPFEFVDETGQITGVSIAIGQAIGEQTGRPVEFRNINFDGLITALKTGAIDLIISSMTATDARRKSLSFSEPYVKTGLSVLIAEGSPVRTRDDLYGPGRRIVVRIGTTGESWCQEQLPQARLVRLDSDAACVLEVINGSVDAWVYDQISILNFHAQHPQRTRALLEPLREEFWAIGMRPDAPATLRDSVNQTLAQMRQNGDFEALAERFMATERRLMHEQDLPFVFDLSP